MQLARVALVARVAAAAAFAPLSGSELFSLKMERLEKVLQY